MFEKLEELLKKYNELTEKISDPEVISDQTSWRKYMKEQSAIKDVVDKYIEYKSVKQAMDEAKEDGLSYTCENGMVLKVNGERADYNKDEAYWGFFVNGDYAQYGIAEQPVEDGDAFKIEYTKAQ